eukprot:symbB.v1.2.022165.t2/scaffold1954.1/size95041/8
MVDIQSLPSGGLRVSNILHVDPSVPRFVPSSIVQGFIKTGVCRGATYLEMAPLAEAHASTATEHAGPQQHRKS